MAENPRSRDRFAQIRFTGIRDGGPHADAPTPMSRYTGGIVLWVSLAIIGLSRAYLLRKKF
jgi:hypothetical protein